MSKAKKIISKIITGGFEVVKDSAEQLTKTVNPDALVKQALGQKTDELTDYLSHSGPNISNEELEKKKKELSLNDQENIEQTRKILRAVIPAHMRLPQKQKELRPYEALQQEEEQKKAKAVEAQKKQPAPLSTPASKQSRGLLFGKRKTQIKGFEGLVKDTKVG